MGDTESTVSTVRSDIQGLRLGKHIPALDGIRGAAILLVLIYHGCILPIETTFEDYFNRLAGVGWCGVDLFFVLSGFLITGILYDAKGAQHYFRNFYARRFFRIFPLYYAALILAFFLMPGFFRVSPQVQHDQWWFWLYWSNFWLAFKGESVVTTLSVTWSLAIEEQFYLVWPLVVFLFSRRTLMGICLIAVPATLVIRSVLYFSGTSPQMVLFITPSRLDTLAVGAFLALLVRDAGGLALLISQAKKVAMVSGAAVIAVFIWQRGFSQKEGLMLTLGLTCIAVHFGSLIALVITAHPDSRLVRFGENSFLRLLGRYSYSIYLFHIPMNLFISDYIWGREQFAIYTGHPIVGQMVFYVLSLAASLGVALITWNVFEKWFLQLKKYFPSH